jgi:nucleoside-diphosphate-sugar epimerase
MDKNVSGIFNVGTGKETSLNALVDMINKALGTSIPRFM